MCGVHKELQAPPAAEEELAPLTDP